MKVVKIKLPKRAEDIPEKVLDHCREIVSGSKLEWFSDEGLHVLDKQTKTITLVSHCELFNQESFDFSALCYSAIGVKYIDASGGVIKPYEPTASDKVHMQSIIDDIPPKLWVSPTGLHAINLKKKEVAMLMPMPGFTESAFIKHKRIFAAIGFDYTRAPEGSPQDPRAQAWMKEQMQGHAKGLVVAEEIGAAPNKKKKKKKGKKK